MTEKQLAKHILDIQEFMGLNNWEIKVRVIEMEDDNVAAHCEDIKYDYFYAYISFNEIHLQDKDEDEIIHMIFHELSHIYTLNALQIITGEDEDLLKESVGSCSWFEMKRKWIMINEQQTEFLARRFHKLYKVK